MSRAVCVKQSALLFALLFLSLIIAACEIRPPPEAPEVWMVIEPNCWGNAWQYGRFEEYTAYWEEEVLREFLTEINRIPVLGYNRTIVDIDAEAACENKKVTEPSQTLRGDKIRVKVKRADVPKMEVFGFKIE